MIRNQINPSGKKIGGWRPNSGRPKGSSCKPKITDHFTQKEIDELVENAKTLAKTNATVAMFLLEQVFGKARQSVGIDGGEEGAPIVFSEIARQNLDKIKNDNIRRMGEVANASTEDGTVGLDQRKPT